jgi:hypothetical protein
MLLLLFSIFCTVPVLVITLNVGLELWVGIELAQASRERYHSLLLEL